ncbi:MAG: acetolactate synthase [Planctomycetota bacterium]
MQTAVPPKTEHGSGYEPASVRQFTVFLENRVGKMALLLNKFEEAGLRINAFSIEESTDISLMRLIASDPEDARRCLRENDFSFSETRVLAVEIPEETRVPMINVAQALLAAEVNIHYAYPLLRSHKDPAIAIYVDDIMFAQRILMRKNFRILGETDLRK